MQRRPVGLYLLVAVFAFAAADLLVTGTGSLAVMPFFSRFRFDPHSPSAQPAVRLFISFGLLSTALGIWSGASAVGLWRLHRWGRISALIQSASLTLFGLLALGLVFISRAMRASAAAPSSIESHAFQHTMAVLTWIAAVPLACGALCFAYLVRKRTGQLFSSKGEAARDPRDLPFSIAAIACLYLLGGLVSLYSAAAVYPAIWFGLLLQGLAGALSHAISCALSFAIGAGLLKRIELARLGAVTLILLQFGSQLVLLLPFGNLRWAAYLRAFAFQRGVAGTGSVPFAGFLQLTIAFSGLVAATMLVALVRQRRIFARIHPSSLPLEGPS